MSGKDRPPGEKDYLERTLHLRVRDKHARLLIEQARWVNFLWNYDNDLSAKVLEREGPPRPVLCARHGAAPKVSQVLE